MLKLSYERKSNEFITVTVLGDAEGIRDLYWQLTHNYTCQDGTAIGQITVTNLAGAKLDVGELMEQPWARSTQLSTLES